MNNHKRKRTFCAAFAVRRSKLGDMLEDANSPILSEALSYMSVVSIVDKKMVCVDWEKKGMKAINNKGHLVKRVFTENKELRDEVERYCKGDGDDIETIAEEFGYPIGMWDVSRVKDFSYIFSSMTFNENINRWNMENGTNVEGMFCGARLFNQSLSQWNVSKVENIAGMFAHAFEFNGNVSTWNTSNVIKMNCMFCYTNNFNGDVSAWDTSSVTNMEFMFLNAQTFSGDLSRWNVSQVTNMISMFVGARNFNQDRLNWERLENINDRDDD